MLHVYAWTGFIHVFLHPLITFSTQVYSDGTDASSMMRVGWSHPHVDLGGGEGERGFRMDITFDLSCSLCFVYYTVCTVILSPSS